MTDRQAILKKDIHVPLLVGLVTVLIIIGSALPLAGPLILLLVAVPLSVVFVWRGYAFAVIASAFVFALMFVLSGLIAQSIFLVVFISLIGFVQAFSVKKLKLKPFTTIFVTATAVWLLAIAYLFLSKTYFNQDLISINMTRMMADIKESASVYKKLGLPENEIKNAVGDMLAIIKSLRYVIPALAGILAILFSMVNFAATRRVLSKIDNEDFSNKQIAYWDVPWFFSWGYMLGIAGELFSSHLTKSLQLTSLNLFVFFTAVFMLQGYFVVSYFFDKWRLPKFFRIFAVFLILLSPVTFQVLSFVGLFDIWFNYRKLERS